METWKILTIIGGSLCGVGVLLTVMSAAMLAGRADRRDGRK